MSYSLQKVEYYILFIFNIYQPCTKKLFSYFSTNTYIVGLDEMVLLSTQNIC